MDIQHLIAVFERTMEAIQAGDFRGYLAAIFFLSGVGGLYSTIIQIQTRRWPVASGQLVHAGLSHGSASVKVDRDAYYDLEYTYTVDGTTYRGDRYSPWGVSASGAAKGLLERTVSKLSKTPDGGLKVYYNPKNPTKSYLKPPGIIGMLFTLVYSLGMIVMPLIVFG